MPLRSSVLCWIFGGHWKVDRWKDGRYRLVCGYGCGWESRGVQTQGQEAIQAQKVIPMNTNHVMRAWPARASSRAAGYRVGSRS